MTSSALERNEYQGKIVQEMFEARRRFCRPQPVKAESDSRCASGKVSISVYASSALERYEY